MARDGLGSSETGLNPAPMESDLCDIRSPARDCDVPARGSGGGRRAGPAIRARPSRQRALLEPGWVPAVRSWFGLAGGIDRVARSWWAGRMGGPVAFVGREGELSRLAGALAGDARMVLVVGDAGVGKTRFTGEGMAGLRRPGW